MSPRSRAAATVAVVAGVPAVVVGVVLLLAAGVVAGVVGLVVVFAIVGSWARFGGDSRVLASLGGREPDPVVDARLVNLVEGLSIGAGVRQPQIRVIESTGLNAMAAGTRPDRAVIGVTTGMLTELTRMELEGVLAEQVAQIRRGDTLPATVLVATFGIGRQIALAPERDADVDVVAMRITRYPPALVSALEKVAAKGAAVSDQPRWMAHLWLVDPGRSGAEATTPLRDRIEALREL